MSEGGVSGSEGGVNVDEFDYDEAGAWLDDHGVDYDALESLEEMISLIKHTQQQRTAGVRHDGGRVPRRQPTKNTQQMMQEIISRDRAMKCELSAVYAEVARFVTRDVDEDIKDVLRPIYGQYETTVAMYMSELVNDECPIIVAGETSAGKSSLLNLLVGTDVLPHRLLCATSTICRLHNSDTKRFEISQEGQERKEFVIDEDDAGENWRERLREEVSGRDSRDENLYKVVDIFWPIPMLQHRVTIVDTPGVGESEVMTKRLMDYLPKAVAFIYVINSAIAGGIQDDKLLRIIGTQRKWESEGKLSYFDTGNAIFVCNKWDRVEASGEEARVWEDTGHKLRTILPDLKPSQVFKMSTSDAIRYLEAGMGYTDKFEALLEGIEQMVPASLKAKVTMHFKWLDGFLKRLQGIVSSRINNARLTEEGKRRLYDTVSKRLNSLKLGSEQVRQKLSKEAEDSCRGLAGKLHEYLKCEDVQTRILTWREDEAPSIEAGDFDVTKFNAERLIMIKVEHELKAWESQADHVRALANKLTALFSHECRLLGQECKEVDLIIEGFGSDGDLQTVIGGDAQPKERGKESLFTGSEKAILAVAAPLWIPLVAAASILFFPVGVGMFIREAVRESHRRKEYAESKAEFMRKWTREIIDTYFTRENLEKFILATYFERFRVKIEELCDDFIPKQIETDQKQIRIINHDMRSSQEILNQYMPIQKKLKAVLGKFFLYDLKYMYTDIIDIKQMRRVRELGKGNFSDVYLVQWERPGRPATAAALKILRRPLQGENIYNQLSEVDCLRALKHVNIVEFYGPCYSTAGGDDSSSDSSGGSSEEGGHSGRSGFTRSWREQTGGTLMLVLELCQDSLEDKIFHEKPLQCRRYANVHERQAAFQFYVEMATGVCDGLGYIHDQGYLHRDLKLSNVLIKDGVAKICDLGFARHEVALTGTFVGTLTHMSPELLSNKPYCNSTDVYSLGILLWELWYGRHVYTEAAYCGYSAPVLVDMVKSEVRPQLTYKFQMPPGLQDQVSRCWAHIPDNRPTASEVGERLNKLYREYHGGVKGAGKRRDSPDAQEVEIVFKRDDSERTRTTGERGEAEIVYKRGAGDSDDKQDDVTVDQADTRADGSSSRSSGESAEEKAKRGDVGTADTHMVDVLGDSRGAIPTASVDRVDALMDMCDSDEIAEIHAECEPVNRQGDDEETDVHRDGELVKTLDNVESENVQKEGETVSRRNEGELVLKMGDLLSSFNTN